MKNAILFLLFIALFACNQANENGTTDEAFTQIDSNQVAEADPVKSEAELVKESDTFKVSDS